MKKTFYSQFVINFWEFNASKINQTYIQNPLQNVCDSLMSHYDQKKNYYIYFFHLSR